MTVPRLNPAEAAARQQFTAWFLYFRETFYVREQKPDIRFAADLGVSRSLVSAVVSGQKTVGLDVAIRMRQVFRRTLDELAFAAPPNAGLTREQNDASAQQGPAKRRHGSGANF